MNSGITEPITEPPKVSPVVVSEVDVDRSGDADQSSNLEDAQSVKLKPMQVLKQNAAPIAECLFIGLFLGLNDGQFGIILPSIKEYYNISDGIVSLLFICQAAGYLIAAFLNGWIVEKLKQRGALYLSGALSVVAYILLLLGLPFPAMCCFMPILGGALALMDAGANVYPSTMPYGTTLLNLIHAAYGLGSLTGPLIASAIFASHLSWKTSYIILACIAALNCLFIWLSFRKVEMHEEEELDVQKPGDGTNADAKPAVRRGRFAQSVRLKFTWLCAFFLLFYVGIETTVGGWGYTFLTTARGGDTVQMGRVMSGYWAGLTVGRVILGHITGMFGEKRMILIYLFATCGMVILIWQATSIGADAAGLVILGAVLGPMFPTAISVSHQVLPKHLHATAVGFLVAFGQGGVAVFPFINGQIIDKAGINSMMPYTLGLSIACTLVWMIVPSPIPVFGFITKWNAKRKGQADNDDLSLEKENTTIT